MAEETPQSKSSANISPQSPVPPGKNEKVGSLVERLRSYESDVARLKGVALNPVVPDKEVKLVPNVPGKPIAPKPTVAPAPTPEPIPTGPSIPAGVNPLNIAPPPPKVTTHSQEPLLNQQPAPKKPTPEVFPVGPAIPAGQNPLNVAPPPPKVTTHSPDPLLNRVPPQNPSGIAGKPDLHIENPGKTVETLKAANTAVSNVVKEDPKKAVAALHKKEPFETMRTIQTDTATASKNPKPLSAQDILARELRKNPAKRVVIEDPRRSFYLLMLSGILIAGGILALGGYYVIAHRPKPGPVIVVDQQTIITPEKTIEIIPQVEDTLMPLLVTARNDARSKKSELIKVSVKESETSAAVSAERFVTLLSPTVPSWLARSFAPFYFAAIHTNETDPSLLLIFKVDNYENGYAGMLEWENTMAQEFGGFFPTKTTGTTTSAVTPSGFRDVVIKNKDVRVLEDASGRRLMLYSFYDPTTLVIATSQATLEEAFARLTTSKFVR
jgi:hypothetical protein